MTGISHPLLDQSAKLRTEVPDILTNTSPEFVEEQMHTRQEFRDAIQRVKNALSDKISEMEALKRHLSLAASETKTDIEKLESYKWNLIRDRKSDRA